ANRPGRDGCLYGASRSFDRARHTDRSVSDSWNSCFASSYEQQELPRRTGQLACCRLSTTVWYSGRVYHRKDASAEFSQDGDRTWFRAWRLRPIVLQLQMRYLLPERLPLCAYARVFRRPEACRQCAARIVTGDGTGARVSVQSRTRIDRRLCLDSTNL